MALHAKALFSLLVRIAVELFFSSPVTAATVTRHLDFDRIDVPIAGLFEAGSVSESAFSFAIYSYNKNPRNPFRLLPKLGILPKSDASALLEKFCELTSDRVVAAFVGELAVDDHGNGQLLADTASAVQVPLFAPLKGADLKGASRSSSPSPTDTPSSYLSSLLPPSTKALSDILVRENWTSFAYVTTSVSGLQRLQSLLAEMENTGNLSQVDVTAHIVARGEDALTTLSALDTSFKKRDVAKHILIDTIAGDSIGGGGGGGGGWTSTGGFDSKPATTVTGATANLMKLFSYLGMNRKEYSYLFAGLNIADLDISDYTHSGVRLAGYRLLDPERSDVKQFLADWQSWTSDSGKPSPPFYHSALMQDAVYLFASLLHCHLQRLDNHHFELAVAELTKTASIIRQGDRVPSAGRSRSSSCYLTDQEGRRMLMYQHSSYQIRQTDVIAKLRLGVLRAVAGKGQCGHLATAPRRPGNLTDSWYSDTAGVEGTTAAARPFRGLTGPMQFDEGLNRQATELVLWSALETSGLQPIARWSQQTQLNFEAFNVLPTPTVPTPEIGRRGESGLVQVLEEDFSPYVIIDRNRLRDFANRTVRVVGILSNPFLQYKERKPGAPELVGNDRFEGFCADFLEEVSRIVGFKYEIHIVYDGAFGTKVGELPPEQVEVLSRRPFSNHLEKRIETRRIQVWNGLIGEILNNTADLVVAPFTVNYGRARVVEFSEPFLAFGLSLIIKKPEKQKTGSFSFLHPLSNSVWLSILAAGLTVSLGLYLVAKISPAEWHLKVNPVTGSRHYERTLNLGNAMWISFAAFVQQGVDFAPRSPGTRILMAAWWFFTLIIIAYYTANLAAFLTIFLRVPPINGWMDLLKSDMHYGSVNSGSTKDFFFNTHLEPFRQMGEFMKRNPSALSDSVQQGVERVRKSKGKYAFVLESLMNEYYNNREPCDTMMVGSPFGNYGYGIAMPRMSPMKEVLSDAVLRLRESQVLASLRKKWWIERGQCNEEDQRSASNALALINVAGVFYILVGGMLLALAVSLIELCYYLRRKRILQRRAERIEEDPWTLQRSAKSR
ncbi:hypothetical protein SprV_0602045400 [Sparganum proliferum]